MQLYILKEVLYDYTDGMAVIAAESMPQCEQIFMEEFGYFTDRNGERVKDEKVQKEFNNANRKSFETQLTSAQTNRDKLATKIDALNDSITNLDIQILDMESKASEGNELGAVQYVSEITGADIKTVANWFIFLLIFVFDPLAITLVIATNQAFDRTKPKTNIYGEPKPTHTPPTPNEEISELIVELPSENERQAILQEIQKIQNSGASSRKMGPAIQNLQNRLSDLDNIKTY